MNGCLLACVAQMLLNPILGFAERILLFVRSKARLWRLARGWRSGLLRDVGGALDDLPARLNRVLGSVRSSAASKVEAAALSSPRTRAEFERRALKSSAGQAKAKGPGAARL